jgi:cell division septal protein FtsQ
MKKFLEKAAEKAVGAYMILVGCWICTALTLQLFFVYLQVSGNEERSQDIANRVSWKIDGTFKNSPGNIWYEEPAPKK